MDTEKNILRGPVSSVSLPPDVTMGQILLDRLKSFGDAVFQIDAETNKQTTFLELLNNSRRLAVYFRDNGVGMDDKIVVCSENSLHFAVPVCAALFLGAAVCPLNPGYSRMEFIHALNISKPKYIFASETALGILDEVSKELPWSPKLVLMGESTTTVAPHMTNLIANINIPNPEGFVLPKINVEDHLLTILCSSGTTGLPKGVMLTDKNFLAIIRQFIDMAPGNLTVETVSLALLPYFHAYSFVSMISQLVLGVTIVLLKRFDPELFLSVIEKYKIENMFLVPPLMVFLAKSPLVDRYDLSSIKQIWCGAAPLSKKIEQMVCQRLNIPFIKQGYGLTETTLAVLKTPNDCNKPGSVGKLTPETFGKVIAVDGESAGQALGPYLEGELCFKGDQIMKGYCGDAGSTASILDEDGWLHTGDVGYYDDEGFFFIVDRLKELIKYKGYQVPPAELEAILLMHPDVQDAAVVGLPDEMSGELPLAFVVKETGSKVTADEIAKFVNERVSSQKWLRGGVRFVGAIPKTASGKIFRRFLREELKSKL